MTPLPGSTGGQHPLAGWIDHRETYGPHVIEAFCQRLPSVRACLDVGAGAGRDLGIVKACFPTAATYGVDWAPAPSLKAVADQVFSLDLERDPLPLPEGSVDLIVANQVLEHTKELFWIFHEMTRVLAVNGHLIIGVPNLASLHNRLLLLGGHHPTQWKSYSAHVRPFTRRDTLRFCSVCFPDGYRLVAFRGSQFYPLPGPLARLASHLFPNAAFSIFFLLQKIRPYQRQFLDHPQQAVLETNFYLGPTQLEALPAASSLLGDGVNPS